MRSLNRGGKVQAITGVGTKGRGTPRIGRQQEHQSGRDFVEKGLVNLSGLRVSARLARPCGEVRGNVVGVAFGVREGPRRSGTRDFGSWLRIGESRPNCGVSKQSWSCSFGHPQASRHLANKTILICTFTSHCLSWLLFRRLSAHQAQRPSVSQYHQQRQWRPLARTPAS